MTDVRLAPDRVGHLGAQHLQRDGLHRRHRGELHEPLGFRMAELAGSAGDSIEAGHQKACGAVATSFAGHGTHLGAGVGRSYGVLRRAHTFPRSRSTSGRPSDALKFSEPAANTLAPAGVS
jgi:hypothetical protein